MSVCSSRPALALRQANMSDDESDDDGPKAPTTTRAVECAYCEGAHACALPLRVTLLPACVCGLPF